MNIQTLFIEGFGSFREPRTIEIPMAGLYILRGGNGAGKTTLFSALCWGLYGIQLKDVNNEEIPTHPALRTSSWRGTAVHVTFSLNGVRYKICRHISYKAKVGGLTANSSLMILDSADNLITSELHKSNQQKFINELLSMDYNLFINTVLFGQRMSRFITSSNEDKRKLLELLFSLEFIAEAKEKAFERQQILRTEVASLEKDLINIEASIKTANHSYQFTKRLIEEKLTEREKTEKLYRDLISELQIKNSTLEQELHNNNLADVSIDSLLARKEELQISRNNYLLQCENYNKNIKQHLGKIQNIQNAITQYLTLKKSRVADLAKIDTVATCSMCKQPLPSDEARKALIKSSLVKEIDELTINYESYLREKEILEVALRDMENQSTAQKEQADSYLIELSNIDNKLNMIESEKNQLNKIHLSIKENNSNLVKYENELLNMEVRYSVAEYEKDLIEIKSNISLYEQSKNATMSSINDLSETLKIVTWWVSTGFGASGLKSYVFNTYLQNLNVLVKRYADRLGVAVLFDIDLSKTSKPFRTLIKRNGVECTYDSLSGGEQQRVDICIAFALHDFVSSKIEVNLLILDELFEGIDDYGGTEDIFDLIRFKAQGKTVFVITHLKNLDCQYSREITVVNNSGNTEITGL